MQPKTEDLKTVSNANKLLGLYIHIPFCVKKCDYCDFLSAPATEEMKGRYVDALITEIKSCSSYYSDYEVQTLFFGGGTPSCLEAVQIEKIMKALRENFHLNKEKLEASIEVNPGTLTEEKLKIYKKAGINRLSFGLQSVNDAELRKLGRIHTYEQFKENYLLARTLGFTNINVDLMSALPEQTLNSWENTLRTILALEPEHISAYSLIVEEGTRFYDRYSEGSADYRLLPDEDTDRGMYHRTKEILKDHGYERYEISNYAKKGFECRHNSSYWVGTDYLGLGLGASSLIEGVRFTKEDNIKQYIVTSERWVAEKAVKGSDYNTTEDNAIITAEGYDINTTEGNDNITAEENDNNTVEGYDNITVEAKAERKENRQNVEWLDPIGLIKESSSLSLEQQMEEFMFLGLRMCKGVSKAEFYQKFKQEVMEVYAKVMRELLGKGLIKEAGDRIYLSDLGIDVSNYVLAEFLLS